jgi:hypothetical protein
MNIDTKVQFKLPQSHILYEMETLKTTTQIIGVLVPTSRRVIKNCIYKYSCSIPQARLHRLRPCSFTLKALTHMD